MSCWVWWNIINFLKRRQWQNLDYVGLFVNSANVLHSSSLLFKKKNCTWGKWRTNHSWSFDTHCMLKPRLNRVLERGSMIWPFFAHFSFLTTQMLVILPKKKFRHFIEPTWEDVVSPPSSALSYKLKKKKKTIIFPSVVGVIFYSDVHSKTLLFLSWSDSFTAYTVVGGQCLFLLFVFSSSLRLHACW